MVAEYRDRQPYYERGNVVYCPITNKAFPYEQGSLQGRRDAIAAQQDWTYQQRQELNKVYGREVTIREWAKIARGESILPQKPVPVAVSNQREETNPFTATLKQARSLRPQQIEAIKIQETEWNERKAAADKIAAVKESDDFRRAQTHAAASLRLAIAASENMGAEYVEKRRALLAQVERGEIENYWTLNEPLDRQQSEKARETHNAKLAAADKAALDYADAKAAAAVSEAQAKMLSLAELPVDLEPTE